MREANGAWRKLLGHERGREERVVTSVAAKDNLVASGQLVDAVEDLIPTVLRHEANERVQCDDGLLIEMVENDCRQRIAIWPLPL